jgi:hypothetical protein
LVSCLWAVRCRVSVNDLVVACLALCGCVYVQLQGKCKDNRLGEGDPDVEAVVAMCSCRVSVNVLVVAVPSCAGYRVGVNVLGRMAERAKAPGWGARCRVGVNALRA